MFYAVAALGLLESSTCHIADMYSFIYYFIETPLDRGRQRNEGVLLLNSFLSLDIFSSVFNTQVGTKKRNINFASLYVRREK